MEEFEYRKGDYVTLYNMENFSSSDINKIIRRFIRGGKDIKIISSFRDGYDRIYILYDSKYRLGAVLRKKGKIYSMVRGCRNIAGKKYIKKIFRSSPEHISKYARKLEAKANAIYYPLGSDIDIKRAKIKESFKSMF